MVKRLSSQSRRKFRVRNKLKTVNNSRPRLSVHRSNTHMYVQLIDDLKGVTLASASSLDKGFDLRGKVTCSDAEKIGSAIAQKLLSLGISEIAFDRGAYMYHGRVRALADAARTAGLKF